MNRPAADAPPAHRRLAAPEFVARVRMREAAGADIPTLVPMINAAYKPRDGWLFGDHMRVQPDDLRDEFGNGRASLKFCSVGISLRNIALKTVFTPELNFLLNAKASLPDA